MDPSILDEIDERTENDQLPNPLEDADFVAVPVWFLLSTFETEPLNFHEI
jgi:hypothetical protein